MDLAIGIIKEQIRFYDFKVRDFQPYFGATKESTEKRLNELKNTLEQLKRVLEIISHESSGLNIADVINWVAASEKSPDYDGDYLCFMHQVRECGAIWKLQLVVTNQFNNWLIEQNETVIAWASLPQPPCL